MNKPPGFVPMAEVEPGLRIVNLATGQTATVTSIVRTEDCPCLVRTDRGTFATPEHGGLVRHNA